MHLQEEQQKTESSVRALGALQVHPVYFSVRISADTVAQRYTTLGRGSDALQQNNGLQFCLAAVHHHTSVKYNTMKTVALRAPVTESTDGIEFRTAAVTLISSLLLFSNNLLKLNGKLFK